MKTFVLLSIFAAVAAAREFNYTEDVSTTPRPIYETTVPSIPHGETNETISTEAPECRPLCTDWILPHPRDCTKFFLCSNLVPYEMNCPAKLHYSEGRRRCDYPAEAGCTAHPTASCDNSDSPPA
ncbi:endochitinase-like [Hyalella azteca]|uniref:Endochitinase-like n=1 Tax=Hyalella azteca TaxID=294128 RepID=A0A8B7N1E4_HYAAZ|nr:endochitinase-like [Hyalella azteca]